MAVFQSADEFYRCVGGLLEELKDDPALFAEMADSGVAIRFRHVEPEAVITLDGRPGFNEIRYGETGVPATVELTMHADLAHRFWLGELNVAAETLKGRIAVRGSLAKLQRLLPLIRPAMKRYPQRLRELGYANLLPNDGGGNPVR